MSLEEEFRRTGTVNDKTFNWCVKCGRWTTTHDTLSHTGGATTIEANLGAVGPGLVFNDPSAWHVDPNLTIGDMWNFIFPWLLLFQFGMMFSYSGVPSLVASFVAPLPGLLFTTLSTTLSAIFLIALWNQGVTSFLAPLFWLAGMLVTLWLGMQVAPDDEPEPRWKRRNRSQESKRQRRKRRGWSPGSIKSHGFHKRYPLSLRSLGHFVRDAPKLDSQLRRSYLFLFLGELEAYL